VEGGLVRAVAARLVCGREAHSVRHALRAQDLAFSRAQPRDISFFFFFFFFFFKLFFLPFFFFIYFFFCFGGVN